MSEKKELETRSKGEVEQTRSGPVFTPAVDIFETEDKITVLADMPGVAADELTIDLRDNELTLRGVVVEKHANDEVEILSEYEPGGTYFRRFTLGEAIDQAKIEASLSGGVLHLDLPKVETMKPRQITVKAT
jgi:HSP20 family molecular chaperone IbpA